MIISLTGEEITEGTTKRIILQVNIQFFFEKIDMIQLNHFFFLVDLFQIKMTNGKWVDIDLQGRSRFPSCILFGTHGSCYMSI